MLKIKKKNNLTELKSTYNKWLYFKEHYTFEAPIDAVLSNFTKMGKDVFVIIVKYGGTKTEIIRAFDQKRNKYIYPNSSITLHALISGHARKEYDLVSKLNSVHTSVLTGVCVPNDILSGLQQVTVAVSSINKSIWYAIYKKIEVVVSC